MKNKIFSLLLLGVILLTVACVNEQTPEATTTTTTFQEMQEYEYENFTVNEEFVPFSDENDTVDIGEMI